MKRLTKYFHLLWLGLLPTLSLAQQPKSVPKFVHYDSGMVNMVGFRLAAPAVLYRQLSDTARCVPAYILLSDDAVIMWQESTHWLKVKRGTRDYINFSADTTTYYMPRTAVNKAQMFILL